MIEPEGILSIEHFIEHLLLRRLSKHTIRAYSQDLALAERWLAKPLAEATGADMRAYCAPLAGLKATSARRRRVSLTQFFAHCRSIGVATADPMTGVPVPQLSKRLPVWLHEDQVGKVFALLGGGGPVERRDNAIFKTLYYAGLRVGELVDLTTTDIDWGGNCLRVRGKGDKERLLPLHPELVRALKAWLRVRPDVPGALFTALQSPHQSLSYQGYYFIVKGRFVQAGLDPRRFSPHKLRHTFATHLLTQGVPIPQISRLLGHARWETTQIYAHTQDSALAPAIARLQVYPDPASKK